MPNVLGELGEAQMNERRRGECGVVSASRRQHLVKEGEGVNDEKRRRLKVT